MAGIRGNPAPRGNLNSFKHGLAGIAQRRADGLLNPAETINQRRNPVRLTCRHRVAKWRGDTALAVATGHSDVDNFLLISDNVDARLIRNLFHSTSANGTGSESGTSVGAFNRIAAYRLGEMRGPPRPSQLNGLNSLLNPQIMVPP